MIMKVDGIVVIGFEEEAVPAKCEDCGKMDELRPYGKNAANVCFDCAMKDEENAAKMFAQMLKGDA